MKKVLVSLVLLMCCMIASAQEYYVQSAGQGQGGRYLVSVTVNVTLQCRGFGHEVCRSGRDVPWLDGSRRLW